MQLGTAAIVIVISIEGLGGGGGGGGGGCVTAPYVSWVLHKVKTQNDIEAFIVIICAKFQIDITIKN